MSIEVMGGGGGGQEYVKSSAWSIEYTENSIIFDVYNCPDVITTVEVGMYGRESPTSGLTYEGVFYGGRTSLISAGGTSGDPYGYLYTTTRPGVSKLGYCTIKRQYVEGKRATITIQSIYYYDNVHVTFPITSKKPEYIIVIGGYNN